MLLDCLIRVDIDLSKIISLIDHNPIDLNLFIALLRVERFLDRTDTIILGVAILFLTALLTQQDKS